MWRRKCQSFKLDSEKEKVCGDTANMHWLVDHTKEFQKKVSLCFIKYHNAFDGVDHEKAWIILKEMGLPHLIVLTCNLFSGQKKRGPTNRKQYGETECVPISRDVRVDFI